jgi:hypothetical protein
LDSNVFDQLLLRQDVVDKLRQLIDSEQVSSAHDARPGGQLAATPDEQRRSDLLALCNGLTVKVPTGGAVWDVSRWDGASWMPDEHVADFDRPDRPHSPRRAGGPGHK